MIDRPPPTYNLSYSAGSSTFMIIIRGFPAECPPYQELVDQLIYLKLKRVISRASKSLKLLWYPILSRMTIDRIESE
ncbi:hypothetical protein ACTXT7_003065 [Hymenolepis weldensis]